MIFHSKIIKITEEADKNLPDNIIFNLGFIMLFSLYRWKRFRNGDKKVSLLQHIRE